MNRLKRFHEPKWKFIAKLTLTLIMYYNVITPSSLEIYSFNWFIQLLMPIFLCVFYYDTRKAWNEWKNKK